MFGDNTNNNANGQQPFTGNQPTLDAPMTAPSAASAPAVPADTDQPDTSAHQPADNSQPEVATYGADTPADNTAAPATDSAPTTDNAPATDLPAPAAAMPAAGPDDLLNIKQEALQQLTPLVDHLEQSPSEEFRTTMMMIQATDNQDLVKKAFEAAKKIEDDKERAQAFLDIINEINYFTQHHDQ